VYPPDTLSSLSLSLSFSINCVSLSLCLSFSLSFSLSHARAAREKRVEEIARWSNRDFRERDFPARTDRDRRTAAKFTPLQSGVHSRAIEGGEAMEKRERIFHQLKLAFKNAN